MRLIALLFLCLISLLASCGEIEAPDRKELARIHYGTPLVYVRADPACNAKGALSDLGSTKVWVGAKGKMSLVTVDFSGVSGHGLQSEAIADTLWDFQLAYDRLCVVSVENTSICKSPKIQVRDPGKRLYFCKKGGDYPRESLENVALASLIGIQKTHKLHTSVFPHEKLQRVSLLVHPRIVDHKVIENRSAREGLNLDIHYVRTDNAYWFPIADASFIAAVPESAEKKKELAHAEPRLWEMPAIMSHEYGHHVFWQNAPSLTKALSFRSADGSAVSEDALDLANSAINEGFADLVAYYTYLIEYHALGWFQLDGNLFDREVSKTRFSDGSYKKLDDWFLNHFFAQTPKLPIRQHELNPTDDHAVGAVLAHGIFRIFGPQRATQFRVPEISESDARTAYGLIIQWSRRLEEHFVKDRSEIASASDYLKKALGHSLSLGTENTEAGPLLHQCQTLFQVFPIFNQLVEDHCQMHWEHLGS